VQENNAAFAAETEYQKPRFNMSPDQVAARKVKAEQIRSLTARILSLKSSLNQKNAKDTVRGFLPIINVNDGRTVRLPVESVGKILRNNEFDASRIITYIPPLYETSIPGWSEPEIPQSGRKLHPNIYKYHHYVNKFSDAANEYYIRFTVPEERTGKTGTNGKNFIHSAIISNIAVYKKGDGPQQARVILPGEASQSPFVDKRLREFFESTLIR